MLRTLIKCTQHIFQEKRRALKKDVFSLLDIVFAVCKTAKSMMGSMNTIGKYDAANKAILVMELGEKP